MEESHKEKYSKGNYTWLFNKEKNIMSYKCKSKEYGFFY
jgi:hypothetical protein